MERILKAAAVSRQELTEEDLEQINRQTLRPLSAEEVFVFRLAACDNQVDRDFERFTDEALEQMVPLFVGKSVLMDHEWHAGSQTARVYGAQVETDGAVKRLMLRCYMPRSEKNAGIIESIEAGILRECSVGCQVKKAICSICGADQAKTCCTHVPGREYEGALCTMALNHVQDVFEVSFVAVPAQPEAGVVKSKRYGGAEPPPREEPVAPVTLMEKLAAMAAAKNG